MHISYVMDYYSEAEDDTEQSGSITAGSNELELNTASQPARLRLHYGVLAALYLIVLVLAGVALGSFGTSESNVSSFVKANYPPERQRNNCILYASYLGYDIGNVRQVAMLCKRVRNRYTCTCI